MDQLLLKIWLYLQEKGYKMEASFYQSGFWYSLGLIVAIIGVHYNFIVRTTGKKIDDLNKKIDDLSIDNRLNKGEIELLKRVTTKNNNEHELDDMIKKIVEKINLK